MNMRPRAGAWVLAIVVAITGGGCSTTPPQVAAPLPSPSVALLTEAGALKIAFDLAGWTDHETARVGSSRLTTWVEAPVISTDVDRIPASGDHPIWIIRLWAGPGRGLSDSGFVVILDAVDGHAIETQQVIE